MRQSRYFLTLTALALLATGAATLLAMETAVAQDAPPPDPSAMSAEEREAFREARREQWQNMSEQERAATREKHRAEREQHRAAMRERYDNMSEEERAAAREQHRADKEKRRAAMRERYANMSEQERQAMRERRAERGARHPGRGGHGKRGKSPAGSDSDN